MRGEIFNSLRANLRDKEYAEGYSESFLNSYIATQIKVIREQRRMTQGQLGEAIGTTQGGVSRYENVDYSSWSLRTLQKIARAFDVRLKVSFEPYGTLADEVVGFNRASLERVKREEDPALTDIAESAAITNIGIWKALNPSAFSVEKEREAKKDNPTRGTAKEGLLAGDNTTNVDLGGYETYATVVGA